jgi:hypothetical protein
VHRGSEGTGSLPRYPTPEQLASAPVLVSVDALLIAGLSEKEDEAFAAALSACDLLLLTS